MLVLQTCKGDLSRRALGRDLPDGLTDRSEETTHERTHRTRQGHRLAQPDATHGYKDFTLGGFSFRRDEYFAHIGWTTRDGRPLSHTMDIGNFLRALMRDVAWGFFYGGVNFDHVIGTDQPLPDGRPLCRHATTRR